MKRTNDKQALIRAKKLNFAKGSQQSLQRCVQAALASEQRKRGTLQVAKLPVSPSPLRPDQIRAIRRSFNVSQAAFARIMNVSTNAVESWEQGVRQPREATLKLLYIARKHPKILLAM